MINNEQITFLIHGGGLSSRTTGQDIERPTKTLIFSIRRYFPSAKIVLSTWASEQTETYKSIVDYIITTSDPGTTFASKTYNIKSAINRHLISTKTGLNLCTTKYTVVLRTDIYFRNNNLRKVLACLNKKILCLAGGTIDEYTILRRPFCFHLCDFIYGGKTEIIKSLFDIANELDSDLSQMYFERVDKPLFRRQSWNDHFEQRWVPEAFVASQHAKKLGYNIPFHSYDFDKKYKIVSVKYIIDNYELHDRHYLGIKWLKNKNNWQPGLAGVLGRYSRFLFLSRKPQFKIVKYPILILHYLKILSRCILIITLNLFSIIISKFLNITKKGSL